VGGETWRGEERGMRSVWMLCSWASGLASLSKAHGDCSVMLLESDDCCQLHLCTKQLWCSVTEAATTAVGAKASSLCRHSAHTPYCTT